MDPQKLRIGKKGGAKRITQKLKKIRKTPTSKDVFRIVEKSRETEIEKPLKKIAAPEIDLEG